MGLFFSFILDIHDVCILNKYFLYFFQQGGDVNAELSGGRNALHYAADYGQTDVIECLIEAGANVNVGGFILNSF